MNASNKSEESEFDQLCPKTNDVPLSLPRFGKVGPTEILEFQGGSPPGPFNLVWEDSGLGIRIDFMEKPGPIPEVLALVTGRPEHQGQSMVIALQADKQLKFMQRSATLSLDERQTCGGRVSFGPVAAIVAKLGHRISADAFLLEPSRTTTYNSKKQ
jgi:hypothetical protein